MGFSVLLLHSTILQTNKNPNQGKIKKKTQHTKTKTEPTPTPVSDIPEIYWEIYRNFQRNFYQIL